MGRRMSSMAVVILLLFGVLAIQAANIQFVKAPSLNNSKENPRITFAASNYPRGDITAADGELLARSVATGSTFSRQYPLGSLTAGVVGFSSAYYGTWGLEAQYDSYLTAHPQPPHSFVQVLAPTSAAAPWTVLMKKLASSSAPTAAPLRLITGAENGLRTVD